MEVMEQIQMVVFDMAGTTVQDQREVENCFFAAAQKSGLKADRSRINAMMGWPKRKVIQTLWSEQIGQQDPRWAAAVDQTYQLFRIILEHHYQTQPILPVAGAEELFQFLKSKGIKVVLTTGFYRKVANLILERLNWHEGLDENYQQKGTGLIDLSLTPDETGKGRPHPTMIQHAMQTFGLTDPQRVIKIGDTPADLAAGKAAGVLSLAVTNGTHTEVELGVCPNDGLLDSIVDLPHFIETYNKIATGN